MKYCTGEAIPMIGVCRGAQLLCAFAGGTLAQDVKGHEGAHSIVTCDGEIYLPSANHHQLMLPGDVQHELLAWASHSPAEFYLNQNDAITYFPPGFKHPEIVYFNEIRGLAIQPHPEWMAEGPFNDYIRGLVHDYCLTGKTTHAC
jgi:GMP synthase-like glutamine amidotransferase